MNLSQDNIKEFSRLYKARFNVDLEQAESKALGNNLLELIRIVYKSIPNPETGIDEDDNC